MKNARPISDIKKIPYYGKSFPFIPWTFVSKVKVSLVFLKTFYKKTSILSFLSFWTLRLPFSTLKTLGKNKKGLHLMKESFGRMAKLEWFLLIEFYNFIEKKNNKEYAYQFAKEAIQKASEFMMSDFYQAKKLAKFQDPFEAFWEYHKAIFSDDPNYPNELIDEGDCKIMLVHDCRNCEIAKLTIPELASLGCDHDITGYKSIEQLTNMEFRRPQTLAKDGKPCKFMFFREGTAPQNIDIK